MHLFKCHGREYKMIAKSKFFDKKWYLKTYQDVATAKMDPVEHYLKYGWKEGRAPCDKITEIFPNFWSYTSNPLLNTTKPKNGNKAKHESNNVHFPFGTTSINYTPTKPLKEYDRLAIFASYSADGKIHDYVIYYLKELRKVCDGIIFISDNPLYKSEISKIQDLVIHIEAKRHKEYDFGSYKRGYLWAKENKLLKNVKELVLCNDSVYGPFEPLKNIFDKMAAKKCDFWGLVEGFDVRQHLQSWFMVFKNNIIQSGLLKDFLATVKQEPSFMDVVANYELKLTDFLRSQQFRCAAYIHSDKFLNCEQNINGNTNITECFPYYLLKNKNFPFVKIKGCFHNNKNNYLHDDPQNLLRFIKNKNKTMYDYIKDDLFVKNPATYKYLFETESVADLIKKAKVVSFDCFDTLLTRPYVSPTDLFLHMERFYNIKGFQKERIRAEQRARTNTSKCDISIDDIYANILPKFKKYKQNELLFEETVLKRIDKNYLLYQEALKQHKPIIVVSNMYLSASFIKSVLANNGYNKIQKVYVSNQYNATKGMGDLFRYVLQDFDLQPNELLHIGDNEHSDVIGPRNMGIKTFFTKNPLDIHSGYYGLRKYYQYFQKHLGLETSVLLSLIIKHSLDHNLNYWQQIGYAIAAPFVCGYISKIEEETIKNKIDTLLFVARDGYLLKKYYNILCNNPVKNYYIYAPRVLNLKCFGDWCDNVLYLRKYAKLLSGNIKQFIGVESEQAIKQALDFYADKVTMFLHKNKSNYMNYLKKQKISGNRIASVDMTTGAFTSEKFLSRIFMDKYKFGFFSAAFNDKNDIYRYITFKDNILSPQDTGCMEFLELLITSPEPPISDIYNNTAIYKPVCDYDKQRIKILKDIEYGIDMFITDIRNIFITNSGLDLFRCLTFSMESIMSEIKMFCCHMSAYDKYKLENVMHSGDVLNEDYVSLYQEMKKYT